MFEGVKIRISKEFRPESFLFYISQVFLNSGLMDKK